MSLERARAIIAEVLEAEDPNPIVCLTGAGISAESGIPTFRGEEGYWKVGSRNYHPQELATFEAFTEIPEEVWSWYLYRRAVCRAAKPNPAHQALAELDGVLGDRLLLVTQNVDGLHLRAGSAPERTFQIHGNIDFMRPVSGGAVLPIPEGIDEAWPKERRLNDAERALLQHEGEPTRPHVLWFDETYDEEHFRFDSSIRAATTTPLLLVVGTSGSTNLPMQIGVLAARRGVPLIVVNPEPNPFCELVQLMGTGVFVEGNAGALVPALCDALAGR